MLKVSFRFHTKLGARGSTDYISMAAGGKSWSGPAIRPKGRKRCD